MLSCVSTCEAGKVCLGCVSCVSSSQGEINQNQWSGELGLERLSMNAPVPFATPHCPSVSSIDADQSINTMTGKHDGRRPSPLSKSGSFDRSWLITIASSPSQGKAKICCWSLTRPTKCEHSRQVKGNSLLVNTSQSDRITTKLVPSIGLGLLLY